MWAGPKKIPTRTIDWPDFPDVRFPIECVTVPAYIGVTGDGYEGKGDHFDKHSGDG